MAILLSSEKESVKKRWRDCLEAKFQIFEASSLDETFFHFQKFDIEAILLHRLLVDSDKLRLLQSKCPASKIILLSDRPSDEEGLVCLRLGCLGYGNTYISSSRLLAAVENVGAGQVWVNSSLMAALISGLVAVDEPENLASKKDNMAVFSNLSKREYQVAQLVASGLKNNAIAKNVGVTERTVKAHLSSIYAKTGAKGRLNLALLLQGAARRKEIR